MVKLRNKKQQKAIAIAFITLLLGILILFNALLNTTGTACNYFDFKVLDLFYRLAVKYEFGPEPSFSPGIVYLNITDETYNFFDKNYLDRQDMASINNALSQMDTEAVIFDIIFARRSNENSDNAFSQSLETLGNAYLPTALVLSDEPYKFKWKEDAAHERFRADYLGLPKEIGIDTDNQKNYRPFYAIKALMQQSEFAIRAKGSGDISAKADSDGIYRHTNIIVKVDDKYFPTLTLSAFLDWAGVSLNQINIEWGKQITVPAINGSLLDKDIIIPIDRHGRTFIPFVQSMGKDFKYISANKFLTHFEDENLRGNLLELFEGNFVFVGDIAIGTSDLGYTPLQNDAPLVIIHASLLNAMLTNTFYSEWQLTEALFVILSLLVLITFASLFRSSWFLYYACILIIIGVPVFTWFEFISFRLFPVFTVLSNFMIILFVFVTTLETSGAKERTFIKNTFARYVPEKVVNTLLAQPEMVSLGGEERIITVLFSDIANFTTISESLSPTELVNFLNEYFTEMTDIIMSNGGIIDKFQGDSIMAEFGVPIPIADHADRAVTAALKMIERLSELRQIWRKRNENISENTILTSKKTKNSKTNLSINNRYNNRNQPHDIYCRIGINTNNMIVGNMGSKKVFDYTVIGDAVNLASRLESANKLYGTSLMISEFTLKHLTPGMFKTRILDYIRVKGKSKPVFVYEVYGINENNGIPSDSQNNESANHDFGKRFNNNNKNPYSIVNHENQIEEEYYSIYNQGFEAYIDKRFTQSLELFNIALKFRNGDKACTEMIERINNILKKIDSSYQYLDSNWDGAISLKSK